MGLVPIFPALVNPEGQLILRKTDRERRRQWLLSLAGQNVEVIVRRVPRQRTLDQNEYIHAVPVAMVADHTGKSIDEAKRDLMGDCWGWRRNDETGQLEPVKAHTSSMSVEECTYFIEWVAPFCLEHYGFEVPLPGEVEYL